MQSLKYVQKQSDDVLEFSRQVLRENGELMAKVALYEAILDSGCPYLGKETLSSGEQVFVCKERTGEELNLYLYRIGDTPESRPRLSAVLSGDQSCTIVGIQQPGEDVCKGYGSALMRFFLMEMKALGIKVVTGPLPAAADEHRERWLHFFEKFDFVVLDDSIKKTLI